MNINRNNYEEYFLLYADNELSPAEKNMVDVFVTDNPDLQEELWMLQQSIVKPDVVVFDGKEKLLKPEAIDRITEEKLLLLLDNELIGKEKEQLLLSIQNNTVLKQEWELLQQTKLTAANIIVFEDKASLYKKEGSRVVPIKWWRVAAAAMLIGFGLWGTVSYFNKDGENIPVTETAGTKKNIPSKSNEGNIVAVQDNGNVTITKTTDAATVPVKSIAEKTSLKIQTPGSKKVNIVALGNDGNDNNIATTKDNNKDETTASDNINKEASNKKITAIVIPEIQTNKITSTNEIPSALPNAVATKASFTSETGDKNSFAFDDDNEDKPRKSKLGGFFKRVKRVVERKTNIKTGSTDEVKIANMSFAMH